MFGTEGKVLDRETSEGQWYVVRASERRPIGSELNPHPILQSVVRGFIYI